MTDTPAQPGAPLHGPGGLLATPGMGGGRRARKGARWGIRMKAKQIAGNLYRGDDGKFQRGGAGSASATPARGVQLSAQPRAPKAPASPKAPKARGGGKGRAAAKPKPTAAERAQARNQAQAAERQANQAKVASALADADASIAPTGVAAVQAAAAGGPLDATTGADLQKLGYAQQNPDGSYRLSPEGVALAHAMDRGDTRAALDADGRAQERAAKLAKAAAPKGGGGGGGGGKKEPTADEKQRQQAQQRAATATATAPQVGLAAADVDALRQGAEAGGASSATLTKLGLIGPDGDATDQGRRALAALERGDVRGYRAAIQDAAARLQREADRAGRQAQTSADRQRRQAETDRRRADSDARRAAADARRQRAEARAAARAESAANGTSRARITRKAAARLIVYKDAGGRPRWLARTTTAYRDRDDEILPVAALDADSARMTRTKQFGPLRWWHVGDPDPLDAAAPWGPGLNLGDCDFSMLIGRTRVEGGTFRDARIARQVAAVADRLELSPGFFHALDQPDAQGVYSALRTFERSLVPTRYGRAANLFTGFTVKEHRMELDEMERRFKAAIAELHLDAQQATALGQQLVATEKAASAQGIAYKSEAAAPPAEITIGGVIYTVKAAAKSDAMPPALAEALPAAATKAPGDEASEDPAMEGTPADSAQDAGDYLGDMTVADFEAMLSTALAPLIKALDVAGKMSGYVEELKGMMGGVATKDAGHAAEIARLKEQQAALAQRLAELQGDAPAVGLPADVEAALKSAGPTTPADPQTSTVPTDDPDRPWAGWGALTFPELYNLPKNGQG